MCHADYIEILQSKANKKSTWKRCCLFRPSAQVLTQRVLKGWYSVSMCQVPFLKLTPAPFLFVHTSFIYTTDSICFWNYMHSQNINIYIFNINNYVNYACYCSQKFQKTVYHFVKFHQRYKQNMIFKTGSYYSLF